MELAFDGICEFVLVAEDTERMVDFYEGLGLDALSREEGRVWLAVGPHCRIGIWTPGEKEHRDRGGKHVHFALSATRGPLPSPSCAPSTRSWRGRSSTTAATARSTSSTRKATGSRSGTTSARTWTTTSTAS